MTVIGITGTLGSGKGTVVEYLKERYGFKHYSARDFIVEELTRRGMAVNRDSTIAVGNELRATHGPGYIAEELYARAEKAGGDAVIESIRTVGECETLKANGKFILLAVDAEPRLRYERVLMRKSPLDQVSFEEFMEHEKQEMSSSDPNKQNLAACIRLADRVIRNDGALAELHGQVDAALAKMGV